MGTSNRTRGMGAQNRGARNAPCSDSVPALISPPHKAYASFPDACMLSRLASSYFFESPLKELWRSRPSEVTSRNSTSATKLGSTHVALGFLIGFVSLDFGLTTVSSCFLIWLETVRAQPVPTLPM